MPRLAATLLFLACAAAASVMRVEAQSDAAASTAEPAATINLGNIAQVMENLPAAFELFKKTFERSYTGTAEEQKSYANFASNLANALLAQKDNPHATFGVTPFSDISESDFASTYLSKVAPVDNADRGLSPQSLKLDAHGLPLQGDSVIKRDDDGYIISYSRGIETPIEDLPNIYKAARRRIGALPAVRGLLKSNEIGGEESLGKQAWDQGEEGGMANRALKAAAVGADGLPTALDWRHYGVVGPVKYQGICGACWAFSVVGCIESIWAIAGLGLPYLSEQQVLSCNSARQDCNGGVTQDAFWWIINRNDGYVALDNYYPYVNSETETVPKCNNEGAGAGAMITNYVVIPKSEDSIKQYVANVGPVSVTIEAYQWQSYTGGIITQCRNLAITHAVIVVGYDTENDPPYWILKNSWSTQWGERGYVRLLMGSNQCLITDDPTIAVVPDNVTTADLPTGAPSRYVARNGADCPKVASVLSYGLVATLAALLVSVMA